MTICAGAWERGAAQIRACVTRTPRLKEWRREGLRTYHIIFVGGRVTRHPTPQSGIGTFVSLALPFTCSRAEAPGVELSVMK